MNKTLIIIITIVLLVGGGAFYGGMKYAESKNPRLSLDQRQQFLQGNNIEGNLQRGAGREAGSNSLTGEVIDKDEQSLTLKMPDGGSRIVFFSGSTQISKTAEGSISDIDIGKQIMVSGDQNSDGSYTAKTIQLSPRYPGR